MKKTPLIVYHSLTGGTEQLVRARAAGAAAADEVSTRLPRAAHTGPTPIALPVSAKCVLEHADPADWR